MSGYGEIVEYLVTEKAMRFTLSDIQINVEGLDTKTGKIFFTRPVNGNLRSVPVLNFIELAFLYSILPEHVGFTTFLFNYEMSYLIHYQKRKPLYLLRLYRPETSDGAGEETSDGASTFNTVQPSGNISNIWFALDSELDGNVTKFMINVIPNIYSEGLDLKREYNQFKMRLNMQDQIPPSRQIPPSGNVRDDNSTPSISQLVNPPNSILKQVQKRPSLCVYASIAHHYLPKDNFIREFMQACTAREDTIDARARAQARIGTAGNWYDEPNTTKDLGPQLSGNGAEYSQNAFRTISATSNIHIITESVEPLFAALIACNKTTLEFKGQESSIDIEYLRDAVINGMWCGQVYDENDVHCHNLLTFLMLMLIGSSSGLPMYASRGWRVVSAVWKKMVQTIKTDTWLARYATQVERAQQDDSGPDVEIKEERLLELIIKVISITHMSDDPNDPVKGFQPGALGYIPYVENYYMRIKSKLGRVKTKAWTDDNDTDEAIPEFGGVYESAVQDPSTTGGVDESAGTDDDIAVEGGDESDDDTGETKSASGGDPFRFARRVRFIEEFSFPADIDDIRDAVRFRFADILGIQTRSKVRFV